MPLSGVAAAVNSVDDGWLAKMRNNGQVLSPPPPPCLGTAVRRNHPLVPWHFPPAAFYAHRIGFFMVTVDARQPFRFAGQHFMCVAWQFMHLERKLRHMAPNLRYLQASLLLHLFLHFLLCTIDVPMCTAG